MRVTGWLLLVATTSSWGTVAVSGTPPPVPDPEVRAGVFFSGRAGSTDPRTILGTPSQDDFDVASYLLDLNFDEATESLSGSVRVTATSLVDGLDQVVLDLEDDMNVLMVTRGAAGCAFTHQNDRITIALAPAVSSGDPFELTIHYFGSPSPGYFGWDKYDTGGHHGDMVWSLSEPTGARTWWPCKDRPDDKAQVETWWTVRPDWTATGNGVLQGVDILPGGRKRYRWKATHPLTTYLVSVAASSYATFSHGYTPLAGGSMPIDYYVYPEDLSDAQVSLAPTAAMIAFLAQTFGEYPFVEDRYGISAFPFFGAMEHSTNTSYGWVLLDGTNTFDFVNLHEISHQWWGDSVSPETWDDIWLNEGFASYCEALWFEHLGGETAYRSYMAGMDSGSFNGPVYAPVQLFGSTVYDKGAWVLHMLRHVMGDAAFFESLRAWYATHFDGVGNTAQFQANQEAAHGASLDDFFQQWVYGSNRPVYRYGITTADLGDGTYRNYVRIEQTQTDAGTFVMPLDLTLQLPSGDDVRTVWNDQPVQDYVLDTTGAPSALVLDPLGWVLKGPVGVTVLADADTDGVPDSADNCPDVANPLQTDTDGDLDGDACDADDDNDTLDDVDDCAPTDPAAGTPDEVASLTLAGNDLAWTAAARADTYDVTRGTLGSLAGGPGICLETGVSAPGYTDDSTPEAGSGYGYLVRGFDAACGGPGSLGHDSAGAERPSPCP